MILPFSLETKSLPVANNYDLHFLPNGVYETERRETPNYLFPMYYYENDGRSYCSTSVYALIHHKGSFVRNPKFHCTDFFRPTFMTIDSEIQRSRTEYRRSTKELKDPKKITELGTELIQDYITEIEGKYPDYAHLVMMGGKDSQNLVLAKRKSIWLVLSGEPNAPLNEKFIEENQISIDRFISVPNKTESSIIRDEIIASDCFFDVAHFRWVNEVKKIVEEFSGRVVLWIGSSGDGVFSKNNNHRDKDYFAIHDLHVGMAMGIWHQMFKNLFRIPVVSPYQAPRFLNELFYKFDPYFVLESGDVRPAIGDALLGRPVKYPEANPTPLPWNRDRRIQIPTYLKQLEEDGIPMRSDPLKTFVQQSREKAWYTFEYHSNKARGPISRVLHPLRKTTAKLVPALKITRHDISKTEIR